jgi:hypothetical protein
MAEKKRKTLSIILASILIILLAVRGGLYFRSSQRSSKIRVNPIVSLTQNNPAAGMIIIGSALKKYRNNNGHYPRYLRELCPKYIPEIPVVNQNGWRYISNGNNRFTLERTVARNGDTFVYKIDPALKLTKGRAEDKRIMLASVVREVERKVSSQDIILASDVHAKAGLDDLIQQDEIQNNVNETPSKSSQKSIHPWSSAESNGVQISANYKQIASNLQLSSLLVWVSSKETLCFSNVQYSEPVHIKAINSSNAWLVPQHHGG